MCARTFGQPQQISKIFTFLFLFVASHCMETNFKQTQIISDNPDDPSCCPMQPCFNRWRHNDYKQITKKLCKMSHCKWSSPIIGESALHISLLLGTIWDMMWQKKEVQCAIVCSIYVPLRIRRVYSKETQIVMAAPQLNNSMEGFHRLSEHKPCCEHFSYAVCHGTWLLVFSIDPTSI